MAIKTVSKTTTKTPLKSALATKAGKTPAKKNASKGLKDLFEDGLKDIYWAEKTLVKSLPKMYKNATDKKLKLAIENHLRETEVHVKRLESTTPQTIDNIFKSMSAFFK
ncbi:DUF892 family protein [Chryseobacterium sediminis]|jgi:hypothetical protein|uniref:YciE/YciF ferroxidase family protein n=1 Tax=Chryseobacterium sediminis TaxID=1679494 RepID=UPI002865B6B6|nr:DUF892 family protein [Chryseobacterium sediminis]MDR6461598.1 hypothetical protein [Chryseobacterium sediminis]